MLVAFAAVAFAPAAEARPPHPPEHWVATWTAAAMAPFSAVGEPRAFENQTLRQIVHLSVGGERLRLRLSNEYGEAPLRVGAVQVALHDQGAAIVDGSSRAVTFGGEPSVSIPVGASLVSDDIAFETAPMADLAVSIYVPESTGLATYHDSSDQTAHISTPGDFSAALDLPVQATALSRYWLTAVEISRHRRVPAVVAIGDSIAEGYRSTIDANHRWPDYLSARANAAGGQPLAVLNQAIGCNRLTHEFCGPSGLARFDRDVLAQSGVSHVIVALGLVDLAFPNVAGVPEETVSAEDVIFGLEQLIVRGHAQSLEVFGATLTPNEGSTFPGFFTPENEAKRQAINAWIRGAGAFDAVIDFDAAVRDPAQPSRLLLEYASDDFTHPSDAGYAAMAGAIDLALFR